MKTLVLAILLLPAVALAQSKVAVVKMVRGEASMVEGGKTTPLAVDQWVVAGAQVKTSERSFVRLVFIDKSTMNIGPNSEMKIEQYGGGDSGVIDLVKGKIRSQVSKDYLEQKDKDRSKVFVKTPNAVMGIRGTDFMLSTNGANTSAVLFEGEVVFNKYESAGTRMDTRALENVVNGPGTARMQPGEFSVMPQGAVQPTVPAVLNVQQRESLENSSEFSTERAPSNQETSSASTRSVVPPGLSGQAVANQPVALNAEVAQVAAVDVAAASKTDAVAAAGFQNGDVVKPTNGSFLHVDSGVVIAPPADSVFDANTNTFVPSGGSGTVAADGNYVPPANVTITDSGKVLVQAGNQVMEMKPTSPVMGNGPTLGDVMKVVSTTPPANLAAAAVKGSTVDPGRLMASVSQTAGKTTLPTGTAAIVLPPNMQALPPREAPTLCSTCGGAMPGTVTNFKEGSTNVTIQGRIGDP